MSRVLTGDVRLAYGQRWIIVGTRRGRAGEARTMVRVATAMEDGTARATETRTLATVQEWPLVGSVRVSLRDDGSYDITETRPVRRWRNR